MKAFKNSIKLQLIYCIICLVVIVCMTLNAIFDGTAFGKACFTFGGVIAILQLANPMAVFGLISSLLFFFLSDVKKSKKALLYLIFSPLVCLFLFALAMSLYSQRGGVV